MKFPLISMGTLALLLLPSPAFGQETGRQGPAQGQDEVQVDPQVEFWVLILAERINDENEAIRRSAQKALVAVGELALPMLNNIAGGGDEAAAKQAKKLIGWIEKAAKHRDKKAGGDHGLPRWEGMGPEKIQRAAEHLGLTDDQKTRFAEILKAHQDKAAELRQNVKDGLIGQKEAHAARAKLKEALKQELGAILTPDQLEMLGKGLRQAGKRPGKAGQLERAVKRLGLTDLQRDQLEAIMKAHHEKAKKVEQEVRDGALDRQDARPAIESLREEFMNEVKGILTPDQFDKFQKAHDDGRPGRGLRGGLRGRRGLGKSGDSPRRPGAGRDF